MVRPMGDSNESMNTASAVQSFQREIIHVSAMKLGRELTAKEKRFAASRRGFIALEMILSCSQAQTGRRLISLARPGRPSGIAGYK